MAEEDIETKYKSLAARQAKLASNKALLEGALTARKKALKDAMDEARKEGFNPDTLSDDIRRNKEVLALKIVTLEADIVSAEEIINPMLKEIG